MGEVAARIQEHAMRLRYQIAAVGVFACLSSAAYAIAPSDQVIVPTPGSSLYSVVDLFQGPNPTTDTGTGSIIGKMQVGDLGFFCVLTADHVITGGANYIGVGTSGGVPPPPSQRLQFATVAAGGASGTEDLRIGSVTVGDIVHNPTAAAVYNSVVPLQVANPMTRPLRVNDLFTEYGYGDTGTATMVGGTPGYMRTASDFIQRFQNNSVLQITANMAAPNPPYVEQQVLWNIVAPANNNGQGASLAGDSGGPYLSSFPSNTTIMRNGNPLSISILTDFIVGVHAFGNNAAVILNGDQSGGVYINQADFNWIENNMICGPLPEPGSGGLLVIGSVGLAFWRRLRRTA
jgi:hypothetical protein